MMTAADRDEQELREMEDELGIGNLDYTQINEDIMSASKISPPRKSSQQLIDQADTRIRKRESIEGTDRPVPRLIEITKTLSDQLDAAVRNLPMTEDYGARCNELYKEYNKKRF